MKIEKEFIWVLYWTLFWAMWVMKTPIYLSKILGDNYINIFRNFIKENIDDLSLNIHDVYILLEWLYEVKENVYENDFETVTWFPLSDLDNLIVYLEACLKNENILFIRIFNLK